jgi:hypothetical protein
MRTKVKLASPETALARILEAFAQELIDVSDAEITEAAKDLGMDPQMKGSAAFAGLKFPAKPQLSDFFEFEARTKLQVAPERIAGATQTEPKRKLRRSRPAEIASERKNPADK